MEKRGNGIERLTNEDLLTEVLSRLRVKWLLRCKAVCKAWLSLISSPSFIKSHIHRVAKQDNDDILIGKISRFEEDDDFQQVNGSFSLIHSRYHHYVAHLIFPYSKGNYRFRTVSHLFGCDFGIVCVCVTGDKTSDLYLWNPATKRSKLIPPWTINIDDFRERVAVGVGFDVVDFDFKVVRVVYLIPAERKSVGENSYVVIYSSDKDELKSTIENASVEVYSAKRNTWQTIQGQLTDVPRRHYMGFDLCLRGYLFAVGYYGMMVFDLNKEVFRCRIKLPIGTAGLSARVVDYKDSIAVISYKFRGPDYKINLWTLDNEACLCDGGVEASWTFMLSVDVGETFDYVRMLFNSVECLLLITNEKVAGEWFSYDLVKKAGDFIYIYPFFDFYNVFKYTESLLSIPGMKLIEWSDDEDENEGNNSEDESEENSYGSDDGNVESNVFF